MSARLSLMRLPEGEGMPLPAYAHAGDAAFDVSAAVPADAPVAIAPGARVAVPTGFRVRVADGHELELRPRSGSAIRHGLTLINSPATIDASYRGHVMVLLVNLGSETVTVSRGDRVAQGIVRPVAVAEIVEDAAAFDEASTRGERGFGSTGVGASTRLPGPTRDGLVTRARVDGLATAAMRVHAAGDVASARRGGGSPEHDDQPVDGVAASVRGDGLATAAVRVHAAYDEAPDREEAAAVRVHAAWEGAPTGDGGPGSGAAGGSPRLADVTEADLEASASLDDLDEAALAIQRRAGVEDGGGAAMALDPETWAGAGRETRVAMLRAWLRLEADLARPR